MEIYWENKHLQTLGLTGGSHPTDALRTDAEVIAIVPSPATLAVMGRQQERHLA